MKTALVTTTINVPHVLKLYRKLDDNLCARLIGVEPTKFFVAGDENTPREVLDFCEEMEDCEYIGWGRQHKLGYKCAPLIPARCIQRRNIAILEALRWGADIIITIDDDNLAITDFFYEMRVALFNKFDGIKVSAAGGWFDVGQLLAPIAPHRGFPHAVNPAWRADPVTDAKVGVAAGICLGDPDISAVERIANYPTVHTVSELLRTGIVVDNQTWTVFNSQNTAFIRELAPAMFLFPGVGRYDDIYASLFTQRIMRELNYHVHFGQPFVWQQRNEHDLIKDLRNEIDGMENVVKLAEYLDEKDILLGEDASVAAMCATLVYGASHLLPHASVQAALAWCDDIEQVMK